MKKYKDNYLLRIAIFFAVMITAGLIFRKVYYKDIINSEQLNIVTTLNNKQAYHPKVIYFKNSWNGYKYWMAFTPYPNADESKENPVINASNDKINWIEPTGTNNPLDIPENAGKYHYNSDTHLLYNEDLNQLELFWRYVDDENNTVTIYKTASKDGINWTEKEVFLYSDNRKELDYVSPAIMYDKGLYKIWFVDKRKVYYTEKTTNSIKEPAILNINYLKGYNTWHLDVIYNQEKKQYELIACAYQDINRRESMSLYYTYSKNNKKWSTPIKILSPSTNQKLWDSEGLYRSSVIYENGKYYLFYSGHDDEMNVGIGLMYGEKIDKLESFSKGVLK